VDRGWLRIKSGRRKERNRLVIT